MEERAFAWLCMATPDAMFVGSASKSLMTHPRPDPVLALNRMPDAALCYQKHLSMWVYGNEDELILRKA
jgi:hypothetical protein